MAEDTIDLDGRREMAAQKATRMRRQRAVVDTGHAAQRARQEELEHFLLAAPAAAWGEAVAKARYLLILFAQSPAAEDLGRARLIAGDAGRAPASLIQRRIAMATEIIAITPMQ